MRKADNTWAKSDSDKANTFAEHLSGIFTSNPNEEGREVMNRVSELLSQALTLDLPIKKFFENEIRTAIKNLDLRKAPGYDLITAKILKKLPEEGVFFLVQLFNAIL